MKIIIIGLIVLLLLLAAPFVVLGAALVCEFILYMLPYLFFLALGINLPFFIYYFIKGLKGK